MPMNVEPKYPVGTRVSHCGNHDGTVMGGQGTVAAVLPWIGGDAYSYKIDSDEYGPIEQLFHDGDLQDVPE